MGTITLQIPQVGVDLNSVADPKVAGNFNVLQTLLNGNVDLSNLSPAAVSALQTGQSYAWLLPTPASVSTAAVAGRLYQVSATATITLPTPTSGTTVGVQAGSAILFSGPVTITAAGGAKIIGLGLGITGATSIQLSSPGALVTLEADGTNWNILDGQQDTGWVALSLNAGWTATAGGYTPSARVIGDRVWLKGGVSYSSGSSPIATLPVGMRPAATVNISTAATFGATVSTAGVITADSFAQQYFDDQSFSLT